MTRQEIDRQIADINRENVLQEEKSRRIHFLNEMYSNNQTRIAGEAKAKQESAEGEIKDRLKMAYMSNAAATEEDFERDYPQLKSEYLRGEAMRKEDTERQRSARALRSAF
jgi:hypothetical protein